MKKALFLLWMGASSAHASSVLVRCEGKGTPSVELAARVDTASRHILGALKYPVVTRLLDRELDEEGTLLMRREADLTLLGSQPHRVALPELVKSGTPPARFVADSRFFQVFDDDIELVTCLFSFPCPFENPQPRRRAFVQRQNLQCETQVVD